jgi:rhodanese-related sulfurtransferase
VTAARIDALLAAARARLDRVAPGDLATAVAAGALVVDIRPEANRRDEGALPGALVVDRNVLEWRLDPTSGYELPVAHEGRRIVLVCNEGYASSLAAATLCDLGLDATDLDGGYRAWAGLRTGATGPDDGVPRGGA